MVEIKSLFNRIGVELSDTPMSYEELRKFKVDCYNESVGNLNAEDGIDCIICKNKGWIQVIEGNYEPHRRCKCLERRESFKKAKQSGLGEYLNKNIDDYIVSEPWQEQCFDKMHKFITKHCSNNTWFVALGQSGCGKTLICSIISNYLLFVAKRKVYYLTWTDFIGQLKRDMMGEKTNEVSVYLDKVKKVDVLFIDEMLKKYNETDLKYLIEIINYRYTNDLKTIITSENTYEKLLDIDEATFGRAVEKCEGFIVNTPKDRKKNYRLKGLRGNL